MPYAYDIAAKRQGSSPLARSTGAAAPDALRKRVLARVRAEPEPMRARLAHAAGRWLGGHRVLLICSALLLDTAIAAAIVINPSGSSQRPLGRASVAAEFRGAHASLHLVGTRAELSISGMPQPPVGEIYEVWLARADGAAHPTDALFTPTRAGRGSVEVPASLRGVHEVSVTAEPVGGSSHPTGPVVLRVLLGRASDA